MARLPRFTFKPFGNGLAGAPLGLEQFGSAAGGSPNYTADPATIQALSTWQNGWNAALAAATPSIPPYVPTWNSTASYDIGFIAQASGILYSSLINGNVGNTPASSPSQWQVITLSAGKSLPFLEDVNAVDFVVGQAVGEILQDGIPLWDSGTTYFTNSIVQSGGVLYQSLQDNNTGNAVGVNSWWTSFSPSTKGENLFRNSSMMIGQRVLSGTITAGSPVYTLDGWILGCTGANMSWSQTPNAINLLRMLGNASMTNAFIKQRIESLIMAPYVNTNNQVLTFQCLIHNNTGASVTPTLTVSSPTAWPDNYTGTSPVLTATNLQAIANGVTQVVSYTFSVAADAYIVNGLEVILSFGAALTAGYVEVGQFDLSATPTLPIGLQSNPPLAQVRPMALEMPFNQRYLQKWEANLVTEFRLIGSSATTQQIEVNLPFSVPMSKVPTLSYGLLANFYAGNYGSTTSLTALTLGTVNKCQGTLLATLTSAILTQGMAGFLTNSNPDALLLVAEL